MYRCDNTGEIFSTPEIVKEDHPEVGDHETFNQCPICGSCSYEEVHEVEGEYIPIGESLTDDQKMDIRQRVRAIFEDYSRGDYDRDVEREIDLEIENL